MSSNLTKKFFLILSVMLSCLQPKFSQAQGLTRVTGKVTDEKKEAVIGASVLSKGSRQGVVTNVSGDFSIPVPDKNGTLIISYLGYETMEINLAGRSEISVRLNPDAKKSQLSEVVVVGYGTQKKVDVTGSVSSINSRDFGDKPFTSPDQILAGRVSGVNVSARSSDPAAPIEVRIRGVGTIGNNQPLYVIDGVPITVSAAVIVNTGSAQETNPLAGINPSDIESIDVLKDASASAIYGARAANGVILVTTKKGKDGRTNITYDGYTGTAYVPANKEFKVLGVADYIGLQRELGNNFSSFSNSPNVNWQDKIFKRGNVFNNNLGISGGNANANYSISAGYLDQQGIEREQKFKRYSLKVSSDIKATSWIKFGESILMSSSDRLVQGEDATFAAYNSSRNAPFFQPYSDNGSYNYLANLGAAGSNATATNYIGLTDQNIENTTIRNYKIVGALYSEIDFLKHFKYRINAGLDANLINGSFHLYNTPLTGNKPEVLDQELGVESTITLSNTLTYSNRWKDHQLTVLGGYEQTDYHLSKDRIQGTTLLYPGLNVASLSPSVSVSQPQDLYALQGLLGRVFYAYKDRYLVTVNVRDDKSSRFAPDYRSDLFPSGSIGWRISEEPFIKKIESINALKLRASVGKTGNQFTGTNFGYLSTLGTTIGYVVGNPQTVVSGSAPLALANATVHWERTTQTDLGLDFSLFNYKVTGTVDYFNKVTRGLLISAPVAYSSGYYAPTDINSGNMLNRGVEFALTYQNKIGDFSYSLGGNFTVLKNQVFGLPADVPYISNSGGSAATTDTKRISNGQPLGYFYGAKMIGIYQTNAEAIAATGNANAKAGDVKYLDVNGDGKIDPTGADRMKLGNAIPNFNYGLNLNLAYKRFDLAVFGNGIGGVSIYNTTRQALESMTNGDNQSISVLNRWTTSNPSTTMPRASNGDPNSNNVFSSRWLENGSYFKLRNIQVGYAVPANVLKNATNNYITSARFYIGVLNPFTLTKYKGYDPEVTRPASFTPGEDQLENGIDAGGSPQPVMFQFGWVIRF